VTGPAADLTAIAAMCRMEPGRAVSLDDLDPGATGDLLDKEDAKDAREAGIARLEDYQARLAAQDRHALVVVLQGLDASGKDGAIKHVMSGLNPQGVHVESFKVPTPVELDHDYLWRYQVALPRRGQIGIFNRSHYEEVLVVRVHEDLLARQQLPDRLVTPDLWSRRFRAINEWEHHLTENGFTVVKVYLHLSRDEQRRRLLARIDTPEKNWKFSPADVHERGHWDAYRHAYDEALSATGTEWAPWHVVPADRKWFARLAVAAIVGQALVAIDPQYPTLSEEQRRDMARYRRLLASDG